MLRRAAAMGVYYGGGGGWPGLAACTESLGSETGDVGGDAEIDQQLGLVAGADGEAAAEEEEEVELLAVASPETARLPRRLPPPMPEGGVMRAERRGGRLILTELRAEQRRREVFRASRDGGRLRLQFAGAGAAVADQDEAATSRSAVDGGEPAGADGGVVGGCGTAPGSPAAARWPPAPAAGGASSLVR